MSEEIKKEEKNIRRDNRPKGRNDFRKKDDNKDPEFDQQIIDLARVTRVMAGGKRMRFRACVAIGNRKGKVAVGLAKGADVTMAINKAVNKAKKDIIDVKIYKESLPHIVKMKKGAAEILLKPTVIGKGIICGGVMRTIMELAGIHNVTGKILGTNNKVNNAKCIIEALKSLKAQPVKEAKEKKELKKEDK